MAKADLTAQRLRELLHYDPKTGVFTRKTSQGGAVIGSAAGCSDAINGYIRIRVDGTLYKAHRLAWFFMTGGWPTQTVDHINQNKADNRFENLRDVEMQHNNQNRSAPNTGTRSGLRGVDWCRSRSQTKTPWRATIGHNGAKLHIGYFSSPQEASSAYWLVKAKIHGYSPRLIADRAES